MSGIEKTPREREIDVLIAMHAMDLLPFIAANTNTPLTPAEVVDRTFAIAREFDRVARLHGVERHMQQASPLSPVLGVPPMLRGR